MKSLEERTCIKFVEQTSEKSFLLFKQLKGCFSAIGVQGRGAQPVSIGVGCGVKPVVIHEIMHALGFVHEQSRLDRDNYVDVLRTRVKPGKKLNAAICSITWLDRLL